MPSLRSIVATATIALLQTSNAWNIELPSCLDKFQPFVSVGCFNDAGASPALIYRSSQSQQQMTVEKCVAECKGNGFRYAGLKYYGVCYCGDTVDGPQVDDNQCTFPCAGDTTGTEICGGQNTLSVWSDPTFDTTSSWTISNYKPAGCYNDNMDHYRALSWPMSGLASLTPSICFAACQARGFPLAGLEYANECWCGNVLANGTALVDDSECNMPCKGDSSSTCGGSNRLNLYVAKQMQSLQPCGYKPDSSSSSSSSAAATTLIVQTVSSSSTPLAQTSSTSTSTSAAQVQSSSSSTSVPQVQTSSTSTSSSVVQVQSSSTTTSRVTSSTSTSNGGYNPVDINSSSSSSSTTSTRAQSTTSTSTAPASTSTASSSSSTTLRITTTSLTPTTSTSSIAMCTATVVVPNTCEYKCGNWCAPSIPDFQNQGDCVNAYRTCFSQITACFKNAGWPAALDCFNFSDWCDGINSYCSGSCSRGRSCAKSSCIKATPPQGGSNPQTTTSVFPCAATTTTATTSATSVAPVATNICQQPTDYWVNYGPGNPVAGIELPLVSCNDIKSDFSSQPFKLYTDSNSRNCKGYSRTQQSSACTDACKTQYDACTNVYAQSCQKLNGKSYFAKRALEAQGIEKRWFNRWSDSYSWATIRCQYQYSDCLIENRNVNAQTRCQNFGSGN